VGALPAGNVTFCFTDIEGSTQLFAKLGPRFLDLLEEHRRIIRSAVEAHGGAEVKTEGDGFFLAFGDPTAAVKACIDFQRALVSYNWPEGGTIRVRAGLHMGEAEPAEGDYMTFAVHEAARIGAAAHGGQTIVSDRLAKVIDGGEVDGVTLRDLGTHQLKDLEPLRLHQICHPDLGTSFPPLRAVGDARGYVPSPASSFIGRTVEVETLIAQMSKARLVTVTGSGGVGKTRIAIEASRSALGSHPDGVWFVDLAPVTDASRVDEVVLDALGVARDTVFDARSQMLAYLAKRDLLIVLDNCEHLIEEASSLAAAILSASPGVSILATSREPLGIDGELASRLRSLDEVTSTELFCERARLVRPDLDLDGDMTAALERIIGRLDGIPLAIELAAARTRALTLSQIAERLDDRFRLLTGGSRTALARQRTLEATVDWSYQLLDDDERSLLRHLSVFVGSFDLEAAEAVWDRDPLDELERLVDKSMVQTQLAGDVIRYRLLETIRHYGWLKLVDAGEADDARDSHMRHFDNIALLNLGLLDSRENEVAPVIRADHDNIRAALGWALGNDRQEIALRMVSHMWMYWAVSARSAEGLELLRQVLDQIDTEQADQELLAQAHAGGAHLSFIQQEHTEHLVHHSSWVVDRARRRAPDDPVRWYDAWAMIILSAAGGTVGVHREDLAQQAVEWAIIANAPFIRGQALTNVRPRPPEGDPYPEQIAHVERTVKLAREAGNASMLAYALNEATLVIADSGDLDRAVDVGNEALAVARRCPNLWFVVFALTGLGRAKGFRGDEDAERWLLEGAEIARDAGIEFPYAVLLIDLGRLALYRGRLEEARASFEEAQGVMSRIAPHRPEMFFVLALARQAIAEVDQVEGNLDAARTVFEENLTLAQLAGIQWITALIQNTLGWHAQARGDLDEASALHRDTYASVAAEPLTERRRQMQACALRGLAGVSLARGDAAQAARLSGAASLSPEPWTNCSQLAWILHLNVLAKEREALGEDAFEAAWAEGRATGLELPAV
jgi:predicted ATPase/class 3 adenylate cyclase